jgi:two-component system sensor histidine kinase PilS (NtrC family)
VIQPRDNPTGQRDEPNPHRRLQWVLGGRLIIATVLLGATMYLALDAIRYGYFTPTFLLILISAIYGSSILFGVWLLRGRGENAVAVAITALDVLLITGLVYLTGGAGSIFSFLYGAQIVTAALTLVTSAASAPRTTRRLQAWLATSCKGSPSTSGGCRRRRISR